MSGLLRDPKRLLASLSPRQIIGAARTRVCARHPYFSDLVWKLRLVEEPGIGTMSVDDGLRLFYDPEAVRSWGVEFTPTVLAHEVQHIRRQHSRRALVIERSGLRSEYERKAEALRSAFGISSWREALNYAFDLEINDEVEAAGWTWPPGFSPLLVKNFDLPTGKTGEFYLRELLARVEDDASDSESNADESESPNGSSSDDESGSSSDDESVGECDGEEKSDQASGSPSDSEGRGDTEPTSEPSNASSSNSDGDSSPNPSEDGVCRGRCGGCAGNSLSHERSDDPSLPEKASGDEVSTTLVRVADAVKNWKPGSGRGVAPGSATLEWAEEMFAPPALDPLAILAKEVRSAVASGRGRTVRTWRAPNRRRGVLARMGWGDSAPLIPVTRGPRSRVVLVLDRSGSMGWGEDSRAAKATNEALGFVKASNGDAFGIAVDSAVQSAVPVKNANDLLLLNRGGGGTDMRVGIKSASEPRLDADVIVLLTDGETPWPSANEMPKAPLVTVVINEDRSVFDSLPKHIRQRAVYLPN